jgi:type I restriction enzyme, S subunit
MKGASEDWREHRLGELLHFSNGVNADRTAYGSGIPFVNVLEIIRHESLMAEDIPGRINLPVKAMSTYQVSCGDILFNRTSETQKELGLAAVYMDDRPVAFGGFVFRGQPISSLMDSEYAKYALRSTFVRKQIMSRGQGGIRANIGQRDLKSVLVRLPKHNEQREITAALDDASTAISYLQRLIAKKQAIKQGMMQQLLTGHVRLPGFSGDWVSTRLGRLIGTLEAGVSVNSTVELGPDAVLKTSAVAGGKFFPQESKTIADSDRRRAKVNPVANSLIISRMNTPTLVGEIAYVDSDWPNLFLPDRLWLARPSADSVTDMRWLAYVLSWPVYSGRLKQMATGTSGSMKNLAKNSLLNLLVSCPSSSEQRAIGTVLADVDDEISTLHVKLTKVRAVKTGMMQQLLTGRIRLPIKEGAS